MMVVNQRKSALLVGSVLAIAAVASQTLQAQPWLEDGRSCFCLRHEQGQVISNCTGIKGTQDFYATATCRKGEKQSANWGERLFTFARVPESPMEIGAYDKCYRAAARRIQAADQDADRAALGGDRAMLFWALLAWGGSWAGADFPTGFSV
jgi:hypothetical protein